MLDNLLHIVGIDLQAELAQLVARANAFKETARREIREELTHAGITAALAAAAILALFATGAVALVALYIWLEPQYGALQAIAAVGGVTATSAVVLGLVAASRSHFQAPEPIVVSPQQPIQRAPAPMNLSTLVSPLPADANVLDVLVHRVSSRAAGATDEAINVAHDAVANGSRKALVGTLAATILIGWVVGRRGGI